MAPFRAMSGSTSMPDSPPPPPCAPPSSGSVPAPPLFGVWTWWRPSGADSPTVPTVASLYQRAPAEAVGVDPSNAKLLSAEVEGVPFPNWRGEFGWLASGTRTDRIGDRATRTVFYRHADKRIAYTIVTGDGIRAPDG